MSDVVGGKTIAEVERSPALRFIASQRLRSTERATRGPMRTYFIAMPGTKFFKVGRSNNPKKRLRHLQVANPFRCVIVGTLSTDREAEILKALVAHRAQGEWFVARKGALTTLRSLRLPKIARRIEKATREGDTRRRPPRRDVELTPVESYIREEQMRRAIRTLESFRAAGGDR